MLQCLPSGGRPQPPYRNRWDPHPLTLGPLNDSGRAPVLRCGGFGRKLPYSPASTHLTGGGRQHQYRVSRRQLAGAWKEAHPPNRESTGTLKNPWRYVTTKAGLIRALQRPLRRSRSHKRRDGVLWIECFRPLHPHTSLSSDHPSGAVNPLRIGFEAPSPSCWHDFNRHRNHLLFPGPPINRSMARAMKGRRPYALGALIQAPMSAS